MQCPFPLPISAFPSVSLSLCLLEFMRFCDSWGAGQPLQPPTWQAQIFSELLLQQGNTICILDKGPLQGVICRSTRNLSIFMRLLHLRPLMNEGRLMRPPHVCLLTDFHKYYVRVWIARRMFRVLAWFVELKTVSCYFKLCRS
jgi:hypothetical protein